MKYTPKTPTVEAREIYEAMLKVVKKYKTPKALFSERVQAKLCGDILIQRIINEHEQYSTGTLAVLYWKEVSRKLRILK